MEHWDSGWRLHLKGWFCEQILAFDTSLYFIEQGTWARILNFLCSVSGAPD
jgi:hypothetical protein